MAARRLKPYRAQGLDSLQAVCPDDNVAMTATGNIFLDPKFGDWYIEYYCPVEREVRVMWSPETQQVAEGTNKSPLQTDDGADRED